MITSFSHPILYILAGRLSQTDKTIFKFNIIILYINTFQSETMTTEATAQKFFSAARFAVVGASSNPDKFGHKGTTLTSNHHLTLPCWASVIPPANSSILVHAWYLAHKLEVKPINPADSVNVGGKNYPTAKSVKELESPKDTGVSIITPPHVTLEVLKEAKSVGIPFIWLQPKTYNDDVLKFALSDDAFEAVVYGDGGRGSEGWCVLVDGDRALKANGKL